MDSLNQYLLFLLQNNVPLVAEPWRLLAEELGVEEVDLRRRVSAMRDAGLIRRIGGVFEAARLGYRQTLLAMAVDSEMLDQAAGVVAGHPGVSHCYQRSDEFNLWATLAVSPDSALGLENTARNLAQHCGAKACLNLPAKRRFKLDVQFGEGRKRGQAPFSLSIDKNAKGQKKAPDPFFSRAVRALQMDLPVESGPFDVIARAEGFASGDELLVHAADFLVSGVLRRYAAVLKHTAVGAKANVLVVWRVPDDKAALAGDAAARHRAVSHCYLRETAPDWPFNLYTMIHAPSREDGVKIIEEISADIGRPERRELETIREYKKSPVPFFSNAEEEWETP